jgi:hypothetical protein
MRLARARIGDKKSATVCRLRPGYDAQGDRRYNSSITDSLLLRGGERAVQEIRNRDGGKNRCQKPCRSGRE